MADGTRLARVAAGDKLLAQVLAGLSRPQKTLPPALFYDARGSALFAEITRLDEYYPTRVETAILEASGADIARAVGPGRVVVIEPGCGAAEKVPLLLRHLDAHAYVGIDVSAEALGLGAARLARAFPALRVVPVVGDFRAPLPLLPEGRRVAFFPGSTLGNFDPPEAATFLAWLREGVGPGGLVILGVDLWKDPAVLHAAYDDARGVTAAFDKNALLHLDARYGADFDPDRFDHVVRVDPGRLRVEMHLRAREAHDVQVAGVAFHFARGETIHTENSYKFTARCLAALAERAGLGPAGVWTDPEDRFAVVALRPLVQ